MGENKRVCRLCLTVSKNDLQPVEEITKDIFDILLLKIDFTRTKEPVICVNCSDGIGKSFEFKSACLYTEDRVAPFANTLNGSKIDLIEVAYMNENENAEHVDMQINAICRFCIKCERRDACIDLDDLEEDFETDVLATCLPEINLKITSKPTMCTACMECLTGYYNLITTSFDVEKNINDYCQAHGVPQGAKVDLGEVYRFVVWNTVGQNDTSNNAVQIKLEENDDLSLDIKTEEIEINDEQKCPKRKTRNSAGRTSKKNLLKCPKCIFVTYQKNHMDRHSLTHLNPSEIVWHTCPECNLKYRATDSLKHHMRQIHGNISEKKIYNCKHCSYSSTNKGNFKSHQKRHSSFTDEDFFRCAKCSFVTPRKSALRSHVRTHMDPAAAKRYKCEDCPYSAYIKARLKQHRLVHEKGDKTFECSQCTFKTRQKGGLNNHVARMHKPRDDSKVFRCFTCDYETKWKNNIASHVLTHMPQPKKDKLKCHLCAYETRSKFSLTAHCLKHRNVKIEGLYTTKKPVAEVEKRYYECYDCGRRFREKMNLKKHIVCTHKRGLINESLLEPADA